MLHTVPAVVQRLIYVLYELYPSFLFAIGDPVRLRQDTLDGITDCEKHNEKNVYKFTNSSFAFRIKCFGKEMCTLIFKVGCYVFAGGS